MCNRLEFGNLIISDSQNRNGGILYETNLFVDKRLESIINQNRYLSILKNKVKDGMYVDDNKNITIW